MKSYGFRAAWMAFLAIVVTGTGCGRLKVDPSVIPEVPENLEELVDQVLDEEDLQDDQDDEVIGDEDTDPDPDTGLLEEVEITASKNYGSAPRSIRGVYRVPRWALMEIPERVPVVDGNGANGKLVIKFVNVTKKRKRRRNGVIVITKKIRRLRCVYRGGSRIPNPYEVRDREEFNRGLYYHFKKCTNSRGHRIRKQAGDTVRVKSHVVVRVKSGDPYRTTEVRATIPVKKWKLR